MSAEELIGKWGAKYKEAKERLATLQAEAKHHAEQLGRTVMMLNSPPRIEQTAPNSTVQLSGYPCKEVLEQLLMKTLFLFRRPLLFAELHGSEFCNG